MSSIGARIRKYRILRGMTYKELSKKCNLSISFLSEVEHGRSSISIDSLKLVAKALGIPVSSLINDEEKNEKDKKEVDLKEILREGTMVMFDGNPLDDTARKGVLQFLELINEFIIKDKRRKDD